MLLQIHRVIFDGAKVVLMWGVHGSLRSQGLVNPWVCDCRDGVGDILPAAQLTVRRALEAGVIQWLVADDPCILPHGARGTPIPLRKVRCNPRCRGHGYG